MLYKVSENDSAHYQQLVLFFPGCPGVTFHLPRDNQITDYVRYRGYYPTLKEGTVCAWVETSDYDVPDLSSFASYSSSLHNNELTLVFRKPTIFGVMARTGSPTNFQMTRLTGLPAKVSLLLLTDRLEKIERKKEIAVAFAPQVQIEQ